MSDLSTKRMLSAYLEQSAQKPGFFTSFFRSPEQNFHSSKEVTIDVRRSGHNIAPVLVDLSAGLNRSENRKFVNKTHVPALYGEEFGIASWESMNRPIGQDNFQDIGFLREIQSAFMLEMQEREAMIRRGVELQCSQVLRTGALTLPGANGSTQFSLDFLPKTSHKMVGVANDWDLTSGTDRLGDVRSVCNLVFNDSGYTPKYVLMGELAREAFFKDAEVQGQTRKDGTGIGEQVPPQLRNGGTFHGRLSVGQFVPEFWSCTGFYDSIADGTPTKYLGDWEVVVIGENVRLDLTWGNIPRIGGPDPRLGALAIGRVNSSQGMIDLITNAWIDPRGTHLFGSCQARPLAIPTAIDGFASINTKVS